MSPFRRIRRWIQRVFSGPSSESVPQTPPEDSQEISSRPTREQFTAPFQRKYDPLPEGWQIEGIFIEGQGFTVDHIPTDSEIESADAIIISYTDALGKDYRTIHGARSREQIATLINRVTLKVSPPR